MLGQTGSWPLHVRPGQAASTVCAAACIPQPQGAPGRSRSCQPAAPHGHMRSSAYLQANPHRPPRGECGSETCDAGTFFNPERFSHTAGVLSMQQILLARQSHALMLAYLNSRSLADGAAPACCGCASPSSSRAKSVPGLSKHTTPNSSRRSSELCHLPGITIEARTSAPQSSRILGLDAGCTSGALLAAG